MQWLELRLDAKTCTTQFVSTRTHLEIVGCKRAVNGQCPSMPKFCRLVQHAWGAPSQLQRLLSAPVWNGILYIDRTVLKRPLRKSAQALSLLRVECPVQLVQLHSNMLMPFAFRQKTIALPACLPCSGIR